MSKRLIELHAHDYSRLIVSDLSGHLLTDQPWFISFIQPQSHICHMMKKHLEELAAYFNGSIQFAYVNANAEEAENLRITYWAYSTPRSFLLDPKTKSAYLFHPTMPIVNETVKWIEQREYLQSPLIF